MGARFWPLLVGVAIFCAIPPTHAGDPNPAMNQPDMVAWRLFTEVVRPAAPSDTTNALFETWASDEDTFNNNPKWPDTAGGKIRKTLITRLGKTGAKFTGRARWATTPAAECEAGKIA